ncbi:hypothetical protein HUV13_18985 [Bacteroides ovatus]|uniref:Uncharacterized protein n=5 Tax=Bacteroidaceae TaxID=815 RepID=A0AAW6IFK3_BACOV|nr:MULTISPECIES: hypothetical protein [Bacteroidales]MBP8088270.1 hypothetical protein [Phocaeicola sp.]QPH58235.1 hypothetical protein ITJ87_01170 [Bacteroides sp. HF-162]MBA4499047.1 hypothetical protein [Bacteroides fragilis]MBA5648013.1 hypothetical protein [Bacteroides fragilis]MBA5659869.1 hypothetical protein [Bacteroides fragilis]
MMLRLERRCQEGFAPDRCQSRTPLQATIDGTIGSDTMLNNYLCDLLAHITLLR